MSCVTVGVVKETNVNTTRTCEVPFLTNTLELEEGEELILEVREKVSTRQPAKRTWKEVYKAEEKKAVAVKSHMRTKTQSEK